MKYAPQRGFANCARIRHMGSCSVPCEPINQYALVTYLPDELGSYLDQVRRDLVLTCNARSHLSLLPPRSLKVPSVQAEAQIQNTVDLAQPFVVKIGGVAMFPMTSVIYLELLAGQDELNSLHRKLSTGSLEFDEPFPFHPHITLAQNFDVGTVSERFEIARTRWNSYTGPREFLLDRIVFVQNSENNCWTDLRSFSLKGLPHATPRPTPESLLSQTF